MEEKNQKPKYRSRKEVIKSCVEVGAMTKKEAEIMQKSVVKADRSKKQGKMYLDLTPYNSILTKKFEEKVARGEITPKQKKTLHLLRVANVKKPHIDNITEVANACEEYVRISVEDETALTLNGLSLALGFSINDLQDIASGKIRCICQDVIKTYIQMVATANELTIGEGSVGAMFLGKNYFGMQDAKSIEIKQDKPEMTDKELQDKYDAVSIIDVESVDEDSDK